MASIDGFHEIAAREFAPLRGPKGSLRRSHRPASRDSGDSVAPERVIVLAVVIVVHLLLLLALRAAMEPSARRHAASPERFEIRIISRQRTLSMPPTRSESKRARPLVAHREDALQAMTLPAPGPAPTPPAGFAAPVWIEPGKGSTPIPTRPALPERVPWERLRASNQLPGADSRGNAPEVRASRSPQQTVAMVGALLFGGGSYDPCPDIERQMVNGDADTRVEAEARYERSCEGR